MISCWVRLKVKTVIHDKEIKCDCFMLVGDPYDPSCC